MTPAPAPTADLPPIDPGRVQLAVVRTEAGRLPTESERAFARAREAYWDGRTDDALQAWRGMLEDPTAWGLPPDMIQWWMIQACEQDGRCGSTAMNSRCHWPCAVRAWWCTRDCRPATA